MRTITTTAERPAQKFRLKNGDLSGYSFLCGYVQEKHIGDRHKRMYMEHSHYHVVSGKHGERFSTWEVFSQDELTKARKHYQQINLKQPAQ